MKLESMKVLFFVRKSKVLKNGEVPIFLRVTVCRQQDEVRIQRSVQLRLWKSAKGYSNGKFIFVASNQHYKLWSDKEHQNVMKKLGWHLLKNSNYEKTTLIVI